MSGAVVLVAVIAPDAIVDANVAACADDNVNAVVALVVNVNALEECE
jgi:hypothetical protein